MNLERLVLALALLLACAPPRAAAANGRACLAAAYDRAAFWGHDAPIQAGAKGDAITFSFDAELSTADMMRLIYSDPKALAELRRIEAKVEPATRVDVMARRIGMSEAQFRAFALRKGVPKDIEAASFTDLNPEYLDRYVKTSNGISFNSMLGLLAKLVQAHLREQGYPVNADIDNRLVEIRHDTWEPTPAGFNKLIVGKLHKKFKKPYTHLHVGIPVSAVDDAGATAIARAVETRIILTMASEVNKEGVIVYDGSNLVDNPRSGARGFVLLGLGEWERPVKMHNLEIRQWYTIEEGMRNAQLAANLAKNASKLRVVRRVSREQRISDPYTLNLPGALEYASKLLAQSPDPARSALARPLRDLAEEAYRTLISDATREKVAAFLTEHDVAALMDESAFLQP